MNSNKVKVGDRFLVTKDNINGTTCSKGEELRVTSIDGYYWAAVSEDNGSSWFFDKSFIGNGLDPIAPAITPLTGEVTESKELPLLMRVDSISLLNLTKRELFAAMAMQGMADAINPIPYICQKAVLIADTLIAELDRK